MKKYLSVAAGLALSSGAMFSAPAAAEVSGNIGVASQYIFRGVNFGDPQVSGGVDWAGEGGFYAGTWISSAGGEQEVDLYAGWANDTFDIGYLYYYFPETAVGTADAAEVYASAAFGPMSVGVAYAPSGFSNTDDDEYLYANVGLDFALSDKASLTLHAGMTELMGDAYTGDTTLMDYAVTFGFGDLYVMVSAIDYDSTLVITQLKNDPTFTVGYGWSFDDIF